MCGEGRFNVSQCYNTYVSQISIIRLINGKPGFFNRKQFQKTTRKISRIPLNKLWHETANNCYETGRFIDSSYQLSNYSNE